jgi:metal-sulfur cluster biosynthetic enzyme
MTEQLDANGHREPAPPRLEDVYRAVSAVNDPCSEAMGRPLSLIEMNLVRRIQIEPAAVVIGITLTEPTCLYSFLIAESVTEAVKASCGPDIEVRIELGSDLPASVWTENQLSTEAAERLELTRRSDRSVRHDTRLVSGKEMIPNGR